MRRQSSGFGFVVLLVVLAVVLFLATRAFKSTLPAAETLVKPTPSADGAAGSAAAQGGGESIRPSRLPDLKDVKRSTDAHAAQVKDALATTQD
jgi:hypothetical protein